MKHRTLQQGAYVTWRGKTGGQQLFRVVRILDGIPRTARLENCWGGQFDEPTSRLRVIYDR